HLLSRDIRFQRCQKNLQPFKIDLELGRQLKEDRTQPPFQVFRTREEQIERFFGVFKTLDVGEEPAGFDCEDKPGWNLNTPALERCFTRQTVKTVIDLDGVEVLREKPQPFCRLHIFRIELTLPPMLVIPST